jgi:hypothetical protein
VKFRDLERQIRHIENARDQRDRGPQRPEKTAGEDAERTPFFNEGVASGKGSGWRESGHTCAIGSLLIRSCEKNIRRNTPMKNTKRCTHENASHSCRIADGSWSHRCHGNCRIDGPGRRQMHDR